MLKTEHKNKLLLHKSTPDVMIVYWCHKMWTMLPQEFLGLFFVTLVDYKSLHLIVPGEKFKFK